VAPWIVSGRVVNTVTGASRSSIGKSISAPLLRPIQFRCIAMTLAGQVPSSCLRSSSSRSAYSVIRKYHWVSFFFSTTAPDRSLVPSGSTCSFASTVWSTGSQLTQLSFRYARPFLYSCRNSHWFQR
jgi:hypothetical protein